MDEDGDAEMEKSGEEVVPITSVSGIWLVRLPLVAVIISEYVPCCARRLVDMVRTELPEPVPLIETGLGLKLELVQRGRPLRERLTLPVNPPEGVTVMLSVPLELTATVRVPEAAPTAKLPVGPAALTCKLTCVWWFRLPLDPVMVTV